MKYKRKEFILPKLQIALMEDAVCHDAFYAEVTREFYRNAMRRHPRFPLLRRMSYGVALCPLHDAQSYFDRIEASGRRNVKKAKRLGYSFGPIDYNAHLEDIQAIRQSTDHRQGKLDAKFLTKSVTPCQNPPPQTATHAYPYFGVLRDGHVYAYAGVLVAGELAMIEHIYGHAEHHANGVVPLLLTGIADHVEQTYPTVRYYGYGTYFGASESLRRFKRKFLFMPHRVKWKL